MSYSMLALHTRYNQQEMEDVLGEGAIFITMLRDPVDVFESQWAYFGFGGFYGMTIGKETKFVSTVSYLILYR